MPKGKRSQRTNTSNLDKNFTVHEAQHLLTSTGGELTVREAVVEIIWSIVLAASLAWAIVVGQASLWHMLVPMVAEYLAYLLVLPLLALYFRHVELRKYSWESIRALLIVGVLLLIAGYVHSRYQQASFQGQLIRDLQIAWEWIYSHQIHWPILVASLHAIRNLWHSVQHLLKYGPPFWGPGLGCGMRIAVLFLAAFIIPTVSMFVAGTAKDLGIRWKPEPGTWQNIFTWLLWGLLLVADLAALAMRWDLQKRLKAKGHRVTLNEDGSPPPPGPSTV
ncbi:MAG: hypothetical protein ABL888_15050 [Pirellulaceae bacterium]